MTSSLLEKKNTASFQLFNMPFYPFELEEQSLCYSSLCSDLFTRQENPGVSVSKILLGFIWKPGRTLRGLPRYKSPSVIPISCPQNKRL